MALTDKDLERLASFVDARIAAALPARGKTRARKAKVPTIAETRESGALLCPLYGHEVDIDGVSTIHACGKRGDGHFGTPNGLAFHVERPSIAEAIAAL